MIRAGWGNTTAALYELADRGIDEEVRASVRRATEKSLLQFPRDDKVELREIQGVKSGQNYLVDLELAVPKSWTVDKLKEVEDAIRVMVGSKVRGVRRLRMRFVPQEAAETTLFDEFISGDISPRASPEPEADHDHGHEHEHGHNHNHEPSGHMGNGEKTQ